MSKNKTGSQAPGSAVFHRHRQEFQDYLPVIQRAQEDIKADISELKAQENWDEATASGVDDWVSDTNTIWRVLRRYRYDTEKAHKGLLTIVAKRVSLQLHDRLPSFPPYSDSSLFYILPLPRHTDLLGRPIVVLTLRQVLRDENGKLDDMKTWSWWALEMTRRTLHDWWGGRAWKEKGEKRLRGRGGEGCVMLVDAAGSSYRNLEVELLPTLMSVGHNHFPGVFDAVIVVNAGWTHRSMWGVVKKVLPKSALDKVAFLNKPKELEQVFDLDRLPTELGGRDPSSFSICGNPLMHRYSHSPIGVSAPRPPSRSSSTTSIAEIYYSAQNTPSSSRRQSLAGGAGLRMTAADQLRAKPHHDLPLRSADLDSPFDGPTAQTVIDDTGPGPLSRQASRTPSNDEGPIQRIKSLSDFHLYLSPSRLANIDLLSDSDDDGPPVIAPPRKQLLPSILSVTGGGIAARRSIRPPLQLSGKLGLDDARSYSDRLQLHHSKVLETYRDSAAADHIAGRQAVSLVSPVPPVPAKIQTDEAIVMPKGSPTSANPPNTSTEDPKSPKLDLVCISDTDRDPTSSAQPISAFASDANPWYGYPAVRSGSTVRPLHHRNRKRDLVKTLLFLFILRIQSWRDAFERWLGLNKLGTWGRLPRAEYDDPKDPATGLVNSRNSGTRGELVKQNTEKDWIWAVITFLLLRGTWTRILAAPLEAVGLQSVRDVLGLV